MCARGKVGISVLLGEGVGRLRLHEFEMQPIIQRGWNTRPDGKEWDGGWTNGRMDGWIAGWKSCAMLAGWAGLNCPLQQLPIPVKVLRWMRAVFFLFFFLKSRPSHTHPVPSTHSTYLSITLHRFVLAGAKARSSQ